MPSFGFVGGTYTSRAVGADAQRAVNWYPEIVESGNGQSRVVLFPTEGTSLFATLTDSPVRGVINVNGRVFAVGGAKLCEVSSAGVVTERGTVANDDLPVSMAASATELLIVSGGTAYVLTLATNNLSTISTLLDTPSMCGFSDGYFVVLLEDDNRFQISGLFDATTWDPLDVAQVSVFSENVLSMIVDHRELWLFGDGGKSVVYANTGNPDFPFEPVLSGIIEQGAIAKHTPARLDNSILWLGGDERGAGIVWRAQQYTPVRVSTHAVEYAIQQYSTVSDAVSYSYQQDGHSFYVLYFPTAGKTWVYDVATGLWHERSHRGSMGEEEAHKSQCHAYAFGKHLVGDWETGKLYTLSSAYMTDAGDTIRRVRRAPHVGSEMKWLTHNQLTINLESGVGLVSGQGTDPQVMLRWSDDNCKTWSNEHWASAGKLGEYKARAVFRRLGRSRYRVYEISVSDPVAWRLVDAYLE